MTTNKFHTLPDSVKDAYRNMLRSRGEGCWDAGYYLKTYPDLQESGLNTSTAWAHYVQHGQFEDRLER